MKTSIKNSCLAHIPVLFDEMMLGINIKPDDIVIDCTLGLGGHATGCLERLGSKGKVLGFDQDEIVIEAGKQKFSREISQGKIEIFHQKFSEMKNVIFEKKMMGKVSAIMLDLGVSSYQLDDPKRGFSFLANGPLDMRMDPKRNTRTAEEIIAVSTVQELTTIFREYGEEPKAWQIAKAIVAKREKSPFHTTGELAEIFEEKRFYREKSRKHPATKVFQALRIEVNNELEELKIVLEDSIEILKGGGRIAVISFHSLEDRLVKKTMQKWSGNTAEKPLLSRLPVTEKELDNLAVRKGQIVGKFPIIPNDEEVKRNPRARSAKLRIFEKF